MSYVLKLNNSSNGSITPPRPLVKNRTTSYTLTGEGTAVVNLIVEGTKDGVIALNPGSSYIVKVSALMTAKVNSGYNHMSERYYTIWVSDTNVATITYVGVVTESFPLLTMTVSNTLNGTPYLLFTPFTWGAPITTHHLADIEVIQRVRGNV